MSRVRKRRSSGDGGGGGGDSSPTSIMTSDNFSGLKDSSDVAAAAAAACSLTFIPACDVCKSLFSEGRPIFQCGSGTHLACVQCWKISSRPWCICTPESCSRSVVLETLVLPAIKVPCSNAPHGCRQVLSYYSRAAHESEACEFAPVTCVVAACSFSGAPASFLTHLQEIHGIETIDTKEGKRLQLSLPIAASLTPIRVSIGLARSIVCVLHQEILEQGDMSAFFMTFLGPASDEHKMIYEIALGRPPSSVDCISLRSTLMSHARAATAPPSSPPPLRLYACHAACVDDSVKVIVCVKSMTSG